MLKKIIDYAKSIKFEAFQIIQNTTKAHDIKRREGKIVENTISNTTSFLLKGIIYGKAVYSDCEYDNFTAIKKVVDKMKENAKTITINEPEIIYPGDKKYESVPKRDFDFSKINPVDKFKILETLEKEVSKAPHLQMVESCNYSDVLTKVKIINSYGLNLSNTISFASIYPYIVLKKGNDVVSGFDIGFNYDFKSLHPKKVANDTIKKTVAKLGAITKVSQGETKVMLSPYAATLMLYVFSSIFKSSARFSKRTKLVDKLNKKIASNLITIINNPLLESAIAQSSFDNEGVATKETIVVKDGIFKSFLNNLKFAKIYNEPPTGSGAGIGVENFYIAPGKTKVKDALKLVDNGLYIDDFLGLHVGVDTISGDFSLQSLGNLITNGKITTPVKMIVVSGNFYELLNNVEAVCDDFSFNVVPVQNVASPSLVVSGLVVAGE